MRNRGSRRLRSLAFIAAVCLLLPATALGLTGTFKGRTSQGRAATIKVAGRRVLQKSSRISWRASCTASNGKKTYPLTNYTDFGGALKANRFYAHGKFTSYPGGPASELNTVTIQFTIKGRKITGSFSLSALIYYEGTQPPTLSERCSTGKIHFTATHS